MENIIHEDLIKVLIVDDEYIMRQGLKYMINWEQEGYKIAGEATNGKEALKLIEEVKPHIIICDIVMPLLDGVDFAEAVYRMYPQIQTIILSGYDNFEYVKRTLMSGVVDYILKPTLNPEELKKTLKKAAERMPVYIRQQDRGTVSYERMIERYFLGHDKELAMSEFTAFLSAPYFRIYGVTIKKENKKGQDMSAILYQKIERELLKIAGVQKITVSLREELVCVIFCYDLSRNKALLLAVESLNEQLTLLCPEILGVYSRRFTDFEELYTVYQQDILKNVDKSFYYQNQKLLVLDGKITRTPAETFSKFDFFKYNSLLGNRQFEEALRLLQRYNEMALNVQTDVFGLKNQMKNMVYLFLDFLPISDDIKENYRYECFHEIENASYEADYRECVMHIVENLFRLSGQDRIIGDERMHKMLAYISENYREDLKLEDLAEEFNFNYHYLSAYFNQHMKESFSDYLNRMRIEKACLLLKETNYSIAQVSEMTGYSEQSYFSRVFKKITGKTPSIWRRKQDYD